MGARDGARVGPSPGVLLQHARNRGGAVASVVPKAARRSLRQKPLPAPAGPQSETVVTLSRRGLCSGG